MSIARFLHDNQVPVFSPRTGCELLRIIEKISSLSEQDIDIPPRVEAYVAALRLVATVAAAQQAILIDYIQKHIDRTIPANNIVPQGKVV